MKICVLTTSYPLYPGHPAGHFVAAPIAELLKKGHTFTVVAPSDNTHHPLLETDGSVSIQRFQYFPFRSLQRVAYGSGIMPNVRGSLLAKVQLPLFLLSFLVAAWRASRGCDVVHAHWSISGLIGNWCKRFSHIPVVLTVRGTDISGAGGSLISQLTRKAIQKADYVTAVSDKLRQAAVNAGGHPDRAITVRNGVDLKMFSPDSNRAILRGTKIDNAKNIILFAGRLSEVKGPDIALSAFKTLRETVPDSALVFIGDGNMKDALQSQVADSPELADAVLFAGSVDRTEMPAYYQAATALLISSRNEGIPNTLYEAMACGTPVVSAPVGGIPEIITDGVTGIMPEEASAASLCDGLCRLLTSESLQDRLSSASRKWTEEHMSWESASLQYEKVYELAVGEAQ